MTTINLRVTPPLKLPKAPKGYDERDQDHTRRLIELALMAYTRQLQDTISEIGAAVTDQLYTYDPISPFFGTVSTAGAAATGGFIQFSNPVGSGKIVVLYTARILGSTASGLIRARFTSQPGDINGAAAVITTGNAFKMDETDTASAVATFKGTTVATNASYFTASQAHYNEQCLADNTGGWTGQDIIRQGSAYALNSTMPVNRTSTQPIILQPGDAFEAYHNTVNNSLRMYFEWDELDILAVKGTDFADLVTDQPGTHSSCWAYIGQQIGSVSVGAMISFVNPGPKTARITTLNVKANNGSYARLQKTPVPSTLGPGGTTTYGIKGRMARRDALGITCAIYGYNIFTGYGAESIFWRDKGRSGNAGDGPYNQIIGPNSKPILLRPGWALELTNETVNNLPISMLVIWDEIEE